jgi:hypothetical protein
MGNGDGEVEKLKVEVWDLKGASEGNAGAAVAQQEQEGAHSLDTLR